MPGATTKYQLPFPLPSDNNDVPADMQALANAIDGIIAGFSSGTLANRPVSTAGSPGIQDRYFYATDNGLLYRDTGTSWVTIGAQFGQAGDTSTLAFGGAPALGGTGRVADAGHSHGMPANPVTAHVAASDPHSQYALDTDIARYARTFLLMGA
jgi:hypothetical protein